MEEMTNVVVTEVENMEEFEGFQTFTAEGFNGMVMHSIPLQRNLYLMDNIENDSVANIIAEIIDINSIDRDIPICEREPINLYINSGGGDATVGFSLIAVIQKSQTPIHGIALGLCASVALAILASCHVRTGSKYCDFVYHSVYAPAVTENTIGLYGQVMKQLIKTQERYDDVMVENSGLELSFLKEQIKDNKDFYFYIEDAEKFGIIDLVYEETDEEDVKAIIDLINADIKEMTDLIQSYEAV